MLMKRHWVGEIRQKRMNYQTGSGRGLLWEGGAGKKASQRKIGNVVWQMHIEEWGQDTRFQAPSTLAGLLP